MDRKQPQPLSPVLVGEELTVAPEAADEMAQEPFAVARLAGIDRAVAGTVTRERPLKTGPAGFTFECSNAACTALYAGARAQSMVASPARRR